LARQYIGVTGSTRHLEYKQPIGKQLQLSWQWQEIRILLYHTKKQKQKIRKTFGSALLEHMGAIFFFKLGNCFNISLCAHFCSPVPYRRRISAGNEGWGVPGRQKLHGEPWGRGGGGALQPRPAAPSCPGRGGARTCTQFGSYYTVHSIWENGGECLKAFPSDQITVTWLQII
jgi:hypothetical protein